MAIKSVVGQSRIGVEEPLELNVLVERLKRLRALNRPSDTIGLTQYRWRSFSIDKTRGR